jgi:hypothetical protein
MSGYPELSSAPLHVLVSAAGHRRLEAQRMEASDQVLPLDWTSGRHSGNFADLDAVAVNVRNRWIGNVEQHLSLQHALQLFPASFQGLGIRPDAWDGRNVPIERPVILDNLVAGPAHGCWDIRSEHGSIISLTPPRLGDHACEPLWRLAGSAAMSRYEAPISCNTTWGRANLSMNWLMRRQPMVQ